MASFADAALEAEGYELLPPPKDHWKPTVISAQPGPQTLLLTCPANEIFFGGARGGGKTYAFILDWIRHQETWGSRAKGIFFRRSYPELEDAVDKAKELLQPLGARFNDQKKTFVMKNGASLKMRFMDRDSHADLYQGHEYNWMGFDEAEHWPSIAPIKKLKACLRSAKGVTLRFLIAANPGGVGHNWLKARYIDPAKPLKPHRDPETGEWLVFIPSRVTDNLILMANDPKYVNRLRGAGPAWLVRAWLFGDWDVTAGGMFDDVWRRDTHVLEPFVIPPTWKVDRSFDWGSSKPFSVGFWAESDGTPAILPDGEQRTFPKGTIFRIGEIYGWNGKADEGCKKLAVEVARDIKEAEHWLFDPADYEYLYPRHRKPTIQPGPGDNAIFDVQNGQSIAKDMELAGVRWTRSDKSPGSRKAGWEMLRKLMKAGLEVDKTGIVTGPKIGPMEQPGFFCFSTCTHWLRTVPSLPRDQKNLDDVDTKAEDHAGDETRYRVQTKKVSQSSEELLV